MSIAKVGLEVEIAPPQASTSPEQTPPAELVAANPAEILSAAFADIGVLAIVDEKVPARLAERVVLTLNRIVARVELRLSSATILQLPRLHPFGDVILAVLDVSSALDDERAQPPLAELLRRSEERRVGKEWRVP